MLESLGIELRIVIYYFLYFKADRGVCKILMG